MYRVIEVAEVLGVSKVTVYKKIELLKPEIIAHMKVEDGVTFISDYGVNLIKDTIKRKKTRKPKDKALLKVVDLNCELNDSFEKNRQLEKQLEENEYKYREDLLISSRHLDTMINNKKMELDYIIDSNNKLRLALEEANELLLRLENKHVI